ncbi:hypothetical protein [Crenothrix sp.]|uniref:hypothetical protein n=1 Tax=Crenothrix sp. TaxID=3100433 RepID=UPI00374CD505
MEQLCFLPKILVIALLLSACAPQMEVIPILPKYETISLPKIGEIANVQMGESIIDMAHTLSSPAIKFVSDCSFSEQFNRPGTGGIDYKISKDSIFTQDSINNGVPAYCGELSQLTPPFGVKIQTPLN